MIASTLKKAAQHLVISLAGVIPLACTLLSVTDLVKAEEQEQSSIQEVNTAKTLTSEAELRNQLLERLSSKEILSLKELKSFYGRPQSSEPPKGFRSYKNLKAIRALGEKLFFDTRLSQTGKMSCATCHLPEKHFVDGLPLSVEGNGRRSMSLYNIGWDSQWLWNGRAKTLMGQVDLALFSPLAMNTGAHKALLNIWSDTALHKEFANAFSDEHLPEPHRMSAYSLLSALAEYTRSITSPKTLFDEWVEDKASLTSQQEHGFMLFHGKAQCAFCHNGWRFSDGNIYDVGLIPVEESERATTEDIFRKAVGLRKISKRPPYTSIGIFQTLEQVIEFYNRGGFFTRETKSEHIKKLNLTGDESKALIAFLETL